METCGKYRVTRRSDFSHLISLLLLVYLETIYD